MPDDLSPSPPTPHLFAVDSTGLRPCPQCGERQWLQGLTYRQCAACGFRDGPTPQEILGQREDLA
jgi:uncharacterized protein (DUF983 family)